VVGILVHASKALRIDHDDIHLLVRCALEGLLPEPKSLGAGVNSGSNLKSAFFLIEKHSVHKKAFACSIFSYD
jgi:hypothetical protein